MFYRYLQPPYSQTTAQMTKITEYLREIVTQIVKTIAIPNKTATKTCKWMNRLYDSLIQTMCVRCTRTEFNLLDILYALVIHLTNICYLSLQIRLQIESVLIHFGEGLLFLLNPDKTVNGTISAISVKQHDETLQTHILH